MSLVGWKITDIEYRDLQDPTVIYHANTTVDAQGDSMLTVHKRFTQEMRSALQHRWPFRLLQVQVDSRDILNFDEKQAFCSKITVVSEESIDRLYGSNGKNIVSMINRIAKVNWFSSAGDHQGCSDCNKAIWKALSNLSLNGYPIVWVNEEHLPTLLEAMNRGGNKLWERAQEIRGYIAQTAETLEREEILAGTIDGIAKLVSQPLLSGASLHYPRSDERVHHAASQSAANMIKTACAWETMGDMAGGWRLNPFQYFIELFEHGHWPIGIVDGKFYIL